MPYDVNSIQDETGGAGDQFVKFYKAQCARGPDVSCDSHDAFAKLERDIAIGKIAKPPQSANSDDDEETGDAGQRTTGVANQTTGDGAQRKKKRGAKVRADYDEDEDEDADEDEDEYANEDADDGRDSYAHGDSESDAPRRRGRRDETGRFKEATKMIKAAHAAGGVGLPDLCLDTLDKAYSARRDRLAKRRAKLTTSEARDLADTLRRILGGK
jgi:hypothetical protein